MTPPEIWRRLGAVRSAAFEVSGDGVARRGTGRVVVHAADAHTLEWEEEGRSAGPDGAELPYRDRLRWRLREGDGLVSLQHLRHGEAHPVHLGDLAPVSAGRFRSASPHLCGDDIYLAELTLQTDRVELVWQVRGARKDYRMVRTYPSA